MQQAWKLILCNRRRIYPKGGEFGAANRAVLTTGTKFGRGNQGNDMFHTSLSVPRDIYLGFKTDKRSICLPQSFHDLVT